VSGSFLPINIAYNFGKLSLSNFSFNAIFPPLTAGIGVGNSLVPIIPAGYRYLNLNYYTRPLGQLPYLR
jgi:hypothetical protein